MCTDRIGSHAWLPLDFMDQADESPNFFAGPYIDRHSDAREIPEWRAHAAADPATLYVATCGTTQLVYREPAPHIAFLHGDHPLVRAASDEQLALLGWFRGVRCMLIELDAAEQAALPAGAHFEELRGVAALLPSDEAGLLAYARGLSIWRSRHRFCGTCGAALLRERAGHVLRCSNAGCGAEAFPRIDPAIIVMVSDGERALLGRQASWPAGRYSTIAGFVEPGESLEDAVVREVAEETGVIVHDIQLPLLPTLALPRLTDGRLPGTLRAGRGDCGRRGTGGRALVHAHRDRCRRSRIAAIAFDLLSADQKVACRRRHSSRLTRQALQLVSPGARLAGSSQLSADSGGQPRRVSRTAGRALGQVGGSGDSCRS